MAELDPTLNRAHDALRKAYALSQQVDLPEDVRQQRKAEAEKLAVYIKNYKPQVKTPLDEEQEEALLNKPPNKPPRLSNKELPPLVSTSKS